MSLLSKGSIQKQFAHSLIAAVLLTSASATLAGAQSTNQSSETQNVESLEASVASELGSSSAIASNPLASNLPSDWQEESLSPTELAPEFDGDVSVYPHAIDGRQAATLYVKDIPVLTFIGTEINSLSNRSGTVSLASSSSETPLRSGTAEAGNILDNAQESDPVLRATDLGSQLSRAEVDAEALSVRWNEETDEYVVTLDDEDLLALDSRTILADTTEDPAEDALQVTNRLRRLIGDADPVAEIEGLPEPEPTIAAAPTPVIAYTNVGSASWYGPGFNGRRTASGEVFNQNAITAAHRTLPFGTRVLVTNLNTGQQVTVRINDRGPYSGHRIIDLSAGAAAQIGLTRSGVGTVQLDVLAY
ncbi:MAG: septal ring lytic transglycosylase RlpA family protein [Phormidesmis sp.]